MNLFINKDGQLRSGYKIIGVFALYLLLNILLVIIIGFIGAISHNFSILNFFYSQNLNSAFTPVFVQVFDLICWCTAIFIFIKFVDKKNLKYFGLNSIILKCKDFICGLFLGFISISIIFIFLLITKNISLINSLVKPNFSIYTISGLLMFIIVGFKEELLSRGYCITVLNQMKKPWLSILISSVLFSLMHLLNPNVKALGLLNIVLVGILFGYMFVKTKNIWMPVGYHITWNYFQGNIFGFNVSGLDIDGLYEINIVKDNILTGGAFGPEAGILTTIVILLGLLLVWKLPKGDKNIC